VIDPVSVASSIAVAAAVTWTLRAAPFAALVPLRRSELLAHVGERMPLGVMLILAVYSMRGAMAPVETSTTLPLVVALAVTVGLHAWRRNAVLSMFAGTAVHVLLRSVLALA